jgi:hypothetical protein
MRTPKHFSVMDLKRNLNRTQRTIVNITASIATFFLENRHSMLYEFITQEEMGIALNITSTATQEVWFQLTHELQLIVTDRTNGSYFISSIEPDHLCIIRLYVRGSDLGDHSYYANCPHYAAMLEGKSHWIRTIRYASSVYKVRTSGEENEDVEGLGREVLKFGMARLGCSFTADEVHFTGNAVDYLRKLFGKSGHLKGEIVVLRPNIDGLNWPVAGTFHYFEWEGFKAYELTIEQLPEFCASHTQVIVYYLPAPAFGFTFEDPAVTYTSLIELHKTCSFNLVVHDQFLLIKYNKLLFNALHGANNFLYYISPLSNLDPDQLNTNMVIGPAREMKSLIKKKGELETSVSYSVGYTLLLLLQRDHIAKYTPIAYSILETKVKVAQEVLIASGLFVEKHILNPEGGFFYLELKTGLWPDKVNERFEKMSFRIIKKISVMERSAI